MDKQKNAGLPASIQYVPVCTGCGEKIGERVTVIQTHVTGSKNMRVAEYEFQPECCPNCGAKITTIELNWPDIKEAIT